MIVIIDEALICKRCTKYTHTDITIVCVHGQLLYLLDNAISHRRQSRRSPRAAAVTWAVSGTAHHPVLTPERSL